MTFDPALGTDRDWMRQRLGDTDDASPIVPDATYDAYLAESGGVWRLAAAALARSLAASAVNKPRSLTGEGTGSISWGDRASQWLQVAAELEAEASRLGEGGGALWVAEVERGDLGFADAEYSVAFRRA